MVAWLKSLKHDQLHRLIVASVLAVIILIVTTVGLPGMPAGHTFGVIVTVLIVGGSFWAVTEPPILIIGAVIGAVLILMTAPSVLPTMIIVSGLLLVFGVPALIGVSIGLGKGSPDA
jgi:hypothetical protein